MNAQIVIDAIDHSPLNRGLKGVDWLSDPRNVAHVEGDDVVLFDYEGPGLFQVHALLNSRGRPAITVIKRAFASMFGEHGAESIFGLVPERRRHVKFMARWVGMKSCGKRSTVDGVCELFVCQKETMQ